MNAKYILIGAIVYLCSTSLFAGGGRSDGDIMSFYQQTKEPSFSLIAEGQGMFSAMGAVGAMSSDMETCFADNLDPLGPALVFNDPGELHDLFAFTKTLNAIISSSSEPDTQSEIMLQTMLDSYAADQQVNPDSGFPMPVSPQPVSDVSVEVLQEKMKPVALFNRFDLSPVSGESCGEFRIVYGSQFFESEPTGSLLMIFEANYPNPQPEKGIEGCYSVASFWASLEDETISAAEKAELLEEFFYRGIEFDGVDLSPVVTFDNYSGSAGQIRLNTFVSLIWHLREFKAAIEMVNDSSAVVLSPETVKDNPLGELYRASAAGFDASQNIQEKLQLLQEEFQSEFLSTYMDNLLAPEKLGLTDPIDILNGISINNANRFNGFQSDPEFARDMPRLDSGSQFSLDIEDQLKNSSITVKHLINRAGAMTCAGCHLLSGGKAISPTVNWPDKFDFVHVNSLGQLSTSLTNVFLPKRAELMSEYLCGNMPGLPSAESMAWLIPAVNMMRGN